MDINVSNRTQVISRFGPDKCKLTTPKAVLLLFVVGPVLYHAIYACLSMPSVKNCQYDETFSAKKYNVSNRYLARRGRFDKYEVNSSFSQGNTLLQLEGIERSLHQLKPGVLLDEKLVQTALPFDRFFRVKVTAVSCRKMFDMDYNEINRATSLSQKNKITRAEIPAAEYIHKTLECPFFLESRGYILSSLTEEEERFPIAFSLLLYKGVWQFERLLRAIYRPQNLYCIHIDANANKATKEAVAAIVNCFDNVFLASKLIHIEWGKISVLEPELTCMQDLWQKSKAWKYFINLTGQEFPLRTNYELVQILKAFNGANDVDSTLSEKFKWRWEKAGSPPHGLTKVKGSVKIAASRGFVDSVLHDPKIADLLNWTRHTKLPDETFFATINHNPSLKVPGSYTGPPETDDDVKPHVARFVRWQFTERPCSGKWVRNVCIFGIGDLPALAARKEMFANKFYYNYQRFALDCMEELHNNRTRDQYLGKRGFDPSWYAQLSFVKNQINSEPGSYGMAPDKKRRSSFIS